MMRNRVLTVAMAAGVAMALLTSTPSLAGSRGDRAAAGAAIAGAAIVLGALSVGAAANSEVYVEPAPPPPAYGYDRYEEDYYEPDYRRQRDYYGESAHEALRACREGILDAARRYGAYDARLGQVRSVRETRAGGHRVRADMTVYYPRYSRTSMVVCHTEDGYLRSARAD